MAEPLIGEDVGVGVNVLESTGVGLKFDGLVSGVGVPGDSAGVGEAGVGDVGAGEVVPPPT